MQNADDILATLKARGVAQKEIAKVLGVATNNANSLYVPVRKTGKTRRLSYDEGVALIREFNLDKESEGREASNGFIPLSLPVARLLVLYIADQLGKPVQSDDPQVEEAAKDIRAFSEFASRPLFRESAEHAEGFFRGRQSR